MKKLDRILVPVDTSESSDRAVALAGELAADTDAVLDVLHVTYFDSQTDDERESWLPEIATESMGKKAEAVFDRVRSSVPAGVEVRYHQRAGDPAAEILSYAAERQSGLIVLGTRGISVVEGFLKGSVSQEVLEGAACSVLIVK